MKRVQRCEKCGAVSEILLIHQDTCSRATRPLPKVGDRIRLDAMPDDPAPIPTGSLGTVEEVVEFDPPLPISASTWENGRAVKTQLTREPLTAQIWVKWDDGRSLNLCVPGDTFEIIQETT